MLPEDVPTAANAPESAPSIFRSTSSTVSSSRISTSFTATTLPVQTQNHVIRLHL